MSTHANLEDLSALMDGELGREQTRFLLRRLERDAEALRRWERYHLVQASLRGGIPALADADFAATVAARIRLQPLPASAGTRWMRWSVRGMAAAGMVAAALMLVPPQQVLAPGDSVIAAPAPSWLSASPDAHAAAWGERMDATHHDTLPLIDPMARIDTAGFPPDTGVMPYLLDNGQHLERHFRAVDTAGRR